MQPLLPWILAALSIALLATAAIIYIRKRRRLAAEALPTEWALTARPVFSGIEKRLFRLLREALPHHIILCKLPLVRFCQPTDPLTVRYWFLLLGNSHVSFAVCTSNGRVLATIDVDGDKTATHRSNQIKAAALAACKVRHLRCSVDQLPSIPELQLLVPQSASAARRRSQPPPAPRAERATLWQDSGFLQDSFFGMDGRGDVGPSSDLAPLRPEQPRRDKPPGPDEVGGVVIDTPISPLRH